jgi:hypothetical protein
MCNGKSNHQRNRGKRALAFLKSANINLRWRGSAKIISYPVLLSLENHDETRQSGITLL